MDLLSDRASSMIPPGTGFLEAFDTVLKERYERILEQVGIWIPRVVFTDVAEPLVAANYHEALLERWFNMLGNEALRLNRPPWMVQSGFFKGMLGQNVKFFSEYLKWLDSEKAP